MRSLPFRTDYPGHDRRYQQLRRDGATGWDSEIVTADNITRLDRLATACGLAPPGTMLELGCGAGNLTTYFAERGWTANGVDISPTAISWARERALCNELAIEFSVGDVCDLAGYADASFDVVLDGHCLHCIIGEDRRSFLSAARRVLEPTGTLLIMTMSGDFPDTSARGRFDDETRCQIVDGVATRYSGDAKAIIAEVEEAGFSVQYFEIERKRHSADTDNLLVGATP